MWHKGVSMKLYPFSCGWSKKMNEEHDQYVTRLLRITSSAGAFSVNHLQKD